MTAQPTQMPASRRSTLLECAAIVEAVNILRATEAAAVTLLCDNPEADMLDEICAVEVAAEWTHWCPRRFYGRTLRCALARALEARGASPQHLVREH